MKRSACLAITAALIILLSPSLSHSQDSKPITVEEASEFFRQSKTVCGKVVDSKRAEKIPRQPTFLYLDQPYPNHFFTIVIWGEDRGKFDEPPETLYDGKDVCVSGLIVEHKGKPQVVVKNPSQVIIK
jgi:micrococcal nuclease